MELALQQESDVQRIMAEMDCPKGFHCCESEFESLTPVEVIPGSKLVECLKAKESYCPMSFTFGLDSAFCKCPLRRYMAIELGR